MIAGLSTRVQSAHAPACFQLGEGAVHVWVTDLDAVRLGHDDLLSREERTRAARFMRERDGKRWARSRELLRALLGEYLRSDPSALRFVTGAHGKPELLGDSRGLCFNLAHSGGVALYALASRGPVGVDVETATSRIDVLAVTKRAFSPATARRLGELDGEIREREFLRQWVRHEATLKCLGTGLGGGDTDALGRRPWVAELEVGRGTAVAAVAAMGEPGELHCWEWPAVQPSGWKDPPSVDRGVRASPAGLSARGQA
jgi:4'-phosphopantetheinyl transferase